MSKKTLKLTRMAEIEEQEVKWLVVQKQQHNFIQGYASDNCKMGCKITKSPIKSGFLWCG